MSEVSNSSDLPTYEELGLHIWEICQDDDPAIALQALETMLQWFAIGRSFKV